MRSGSVADWTASLVLLCLVVELNRSVLQREGMTLIHKWPLATVLPLATALIVFLNALVLTGLGVISLESRETAIREDIAAAFLDTLAGVAEPVLVNGDGAELQSLLLAAASFKPTLRNNGVVFCCIGNDAVSAIDINGPSDETTTATLLEAYVDEHAGLVPGEPVKRVVDSLQKFLIVKSYQISDGRSYRLAAAFDLEAVQAARHEARRLAFMIDIGFALVAALIAFALVRWALAPLERLTRLLLIPNVPDFKVTEMAGSNTEIGRLQRALGARAQEQERLDALDKAERDRARETVLARLAASLAHEVRNPLAGMSAAVSTLRRFGDKTDVRIQTADLLDRGLSSIDRVAATMLSTYRPEAGERPLTAEDIGDLELLVRPKMQRKHINLTFRSGLEAPFAAPANPVRQIILNLLLNAAEAAPESGSVDFSAERDGDDLVLVVKDDGPGMPEEALAVVTGARGADVPRNGRLGLWLIHKLLDDVGARLAIETAQGKGTMVTITIPSRDIGAKND